MKRAIQRHRQAWKNSESSSCGAASLRLQQELRRSARILLAERLSIEWKLANSAKTAHKKIFAHVNGSKRLTARILQLRHSSGSLINSDQEMAGLLKTTFLGFFREDEGSTPVFQPRRQTYVADPLITDLEVRRALDGLTPHKSADSDGLFPKVLKTLNSHTGPALAQTFNLSLQTAQVPEDCHRAILTPVAKSNIRRVILNYKFLDEGNFHWASTS